MKHLFLLFMLSALAMAGFARSAATVEPIGPPGMPAVIGGNFQADQVPKEFNAIGFDLIALSTSTAPDAARGLPAPRKPT